VIIGFAGMTHLGINSSVATAEKGWKVIGYDSNEENIKQLKKGEVLVEEPGLKELLAKNKDNLTFTENIQRLKDCDIVYISADVGTDENSKSDLNTINSLITNVSSNINKDSLLIVLCQVPPGFTRKISSIETERVFYQVETLVFGNAIERALKPERFIVGCENKETELPDMLLKLLESFDCPIIKMNFESAELTKISINLFLSSSVSVTNMLAELCERIGADWFDIIPALKLDKRIGENAYLRPGLGISGGNLERDLITIQELNKKHNVDHSIIDSWLKGSLQRKKWCLEKLKKHVLSVHLDPKIALLGLSYKENTNSIKNSPSIALLSHLEQENVWVHDPVVNPENIKNAIFSSSVMECIKDSEVLIISTAWPEYKLISASKLIENMSGRIIIDPYRILDGDDLSSLGFEYHTLGVQGNLES